MSRLRSGLFYFIFTIVTSALIYLILIWFTQPQSWYAGMHDAQHELHGLCHCYERFLEKEKHR